MPKTPFSFQHGRDVFQARPGALPLKDAQDLMAYPFFALGKLPRFAPIEYEHQGVFIRVEPTTNIGIATIWDADILIWAASQIVAARDCGLVPSRRIAARPYAMLTYMARGTSAHNYHRLKSALNRLQNTAITTSIRPLSGEARHRFNWLEWRECTDSNGKSTGLELTIADWLYRMVLDKALMLALDRAYFSITGGLERWLYRIVRKHAGKQRSGWRFDFQHLYRKSGAQSPFRNFAGDLRTIIRRQSLPGYELFIEVESNGRILLAFEPKQLAGGQAVNQPGGTDAACRVGTDAALSADQVRKPELTYCRKTRKIAPNFESNRDSNLFCVRQSGENAPEGDAP